ncbi:unnamed protein product, partial [marine sediment metagenome]
YPFNNKTQNITSSNKFVSRIAYRVSRQKPVSRMY